MEDVKELTEMCLYSKVVLVDDLTDFTLWCCDREMQFDENDNRICYPYKVKYRQCSHCVKVKGKKPVEDAMNCCETF